jgi:hypothetical protein
MLQKTFRIISTRNLASIRRTLKYFSVDGLEIFGQEDIRKYGSKLGVAIKENLVSKDLFSVYVDDMRAHLEPFNDMANLCMQADWGYDRSIKDGYSQTQVLDVLKSLITISR